MLANVFTEEPVDSVSIPLTSTITKGSDLVLGPFCLPETPMLARIWPAGVADSTPPETPENRPKGRDFVSFLC